MSRYFTHSVCPFLPVENKPTKNPNIKMFQYQYHLLLLWLSGACISATMAASLPSMSPVSGASTPLPSLGIKNIPFCIRTAEYLNWGGALNGQDCSKAITQLWERLQPYGYTKFTFWSRTFMSNPPSDGWELPIGAASGASASSLLSRDHSRWS